MAKSNTLRNPIAHNHSNEIKRLSRIKGQIEGIERMILETRYCTDIIVQIKAARSALHSLEKNITESHLRHCVTTALKSKNSKLIDQKLEEVLNLMKHSVY
jgi:DNA-binding FrmR family transcriptional regulator